jgi:transcriptional regulator with XRE-family HTH domain
MPIGNSLDISMRIRQVRGKLKKSEFADALGIPRPNLSRYESGRKPPAEVLQKIADYGGVSVKWLLTGKEEGKEETDLVQPLLPEHFPKPQESAWPPIIQEFLFAEVLRVLEAYQDKRGIVYDLKHRARILVALYNHCALHIEPPTLLLAEGFDEELS